MNSINTMDNVLLIAGIAYGVLVFLSAFMSGRFTDAFRVDLFFTRKPTDVTKKLNIFFGLIILGLAIYSYYKH